MFFICSFLRPEEYDFTGRSFYRYQALDSLSSDSSSAEILKPAEFMSGASKLVKKGTIYRGIKIDADSGTGIVSGLNLEVKGSLTDSIEVSAYISDDRLAVTEEGSTEAFSDIEKIYIQFKHPNFLSRMGDFKTDYSAGEFGELRKELSGAFLKINDRNNSVEGFISAQSPAFEKYTVKGVEGISGPYTLKSSSGYEVEIVPGSEVVYLNGIRLGRGDDYFLDYENSELSFTPRIHIRSGDIIAADFQYKASDYEKTVYGFNAQNSFVNNKLRTSLSYFAESENKNKPVTFDMNDEISENMEISPENYVYISGAEFSEGEGDYDLLDSIHYVYAGKGNGDYKVRFTDFGSAGEYDISYDSIGTAFYVYDPIDGGKYMPLIRRNTPGSYSRFHSSVNYTGKNIVAETEFVASGMNENLFYSEDMKFKGFGNRERFVFRTDEKKIGKFEIDLSRKDFNSDLVLHTRLNEIAEEDKIDISNYSDAVGTTAYKGKLLYNFKKYSQIGYEAVFSEFGSNSLRSYKFTSDGYFGSYSYNGSVALSGLKQDSLETKKKYYSFRNSYRTGYFTLSPYYRNITLKESEYIKTTGIDEKKFGNDLKFSYNEKIDIEIKAELAQYDRILDGSRTRYLNSYSGSAGLKGRINSVLYSEALWSKVNNEYVSGDSTDTDYDQLNFRVNYNRSDMYRIYAEYGTERTQFVPKIRSYYKVAEGTGSFVFVDGEYFPDEFGNYEFYTLPAVSGKNVTGVKFDLKTFFDFKDKSENDNILYWLTRIDIEQSLSLYEKTTDPDIIKIMFLDISEFQSDSTVSGLIDSKTELYFLKKHRNSLDYSFNYRKNLSAEYQNYKENSLMKEHAASYLNRSSKFSHRLKGRLSSTNRYGYADIMTDNLAKKYLSYNFRHNISSRMSYFTEFEYGKESETVRKLESDSYRFSAGLNSEIYGKGILRAGADAVNVTSAGSIPYIMNSGYGRGWSYKWNMSSDYEFNKNITGNVTYSGRFLSSDSRPFHELKAEIRMNL